MAVVEALQINFVGINPRTNIFEHLRRAISVRHERGLQSGGFGLFENRYRPFGGNQRLVVSADQDFRAQPECIAHQQFG